LFDEMMLRINREIEFANDGQDARIIAKINALTAPRIIDALYRASAAGVRIDLIVRGVCSLRPGIPGLSENIRVCSIVGRFLEHSRVFYFLNGGKEEFFCSSADWMDRNFFRRTETCFPIRQRPLKTRLKQDLELFLADNCQAWELLPDGTYEKQSVDGATRRSSQQQFLESLAALRSVES